MNLSLLCAILISSATDSPWQQYTSPDAAGWSTEKLSEARRVAEAVGSASVFAVHDGVVVAAWGQVDRPFPLYSIRKGLYNALYGTAVAEGTVDLDHTLAELGIDDIGGLTEVERTATVRHLLTSMSGVYHPAAYEPSSMKRSRPTRGSHRPGEHWFYNNWDFNVAAGVLETATGTSIAELFHDRVATPLGLQDFEPEHVFSFYEPSRSRFTAPIFRMSARDLARVGLLYLRNGKWNGRQVLSRDWVVDSFTPTTTFDADNRFGEGNGFGLLWWIYPGRPDGERVIARHDAFVTRGKGGQVLGVVPSMDLVVVHLTDTENGLGLGFGEAARVIDAIMAAYPDENASSDAPGRTDLNVQELPGARPAPERPRAAAPSPELIRELVGEYRVNPQLTVRIHEVEGRLFVLPQGVPRAEVELFVAPDGRLFSPAVRLTLAVVRDGDGNVVALSGEIDGNATRAERVGVE